MLSLCFFFLCVFFVCLFCFVFCFFFYSTAFVGSLIPPITAARSKPKHSYSDFSLQQRWDQLERLFTCRFGNLTASERETPGFREEWKELYDEYCDDEASHSKAFRALWHHPDQRLLYRYTCRGQRPLLWTLNQLNLKYPLGTVFLPLLTPRDQHSLTLVDYYSYYSALHS